MPLSRCIKIISPLQQIITSRAVSSSSNTTTVTTTTADSNNSSSGTHSIITGRPNRHRLQQSAKVFTMRTPSSIIDVSRSNCGALLTENNNIRSSIRSRLRRRRRLRAPQRARKSPLPRWPPQSFLRLPRTPVQARRVPRTIPPLRIKSTADRPLNNSSSSITPHNNSSSPTTWRGCPRRRGALCRPSTTRRRPTRRARSIRCTLPTARRPVPSTATRSGRRRRQRRQRRPEPLADTWNILTKPRQTLVAAAALVKTITRVEEEKESTAERSSSSSNNISSRSMSFP